MESRDATVNSNSHHGGCGERVEVIRPAGGVVSTAAFRTVLPRIMLAILILASILWSILHRHLFDSSVIEEMLHHWGLWAPLGFVFLDAATTMIFLPGLIFGLAAGVLFGPWWGSLWSLVGATLGATLAFLTARYLTSGWVARHSHGWLKRLIDGVETGGWRFVALVRLVPLFPFNLSNYALGLTRINVAPYVLATLIFQVPGTTAYAYLGYAGRELAAGNHHAISMVLFAVGALAVLALLPGLVHRWRRKKA